MRAQIESERAAAQLKIDHITRSYEQLRREFQVYRLQSDASATPGSLASGRRTGEAKRRKVSLVEDVAQLPPRAGALSPPRNVVAKESAVDPCGLCTPSSECFCSNVGFVIRPLAPAASSALPLRVRPSGPKLPSIWSIGVAGEPAPTCSGDVENCRVCHNDP